LNTAEKITITAETEKTIEALLDRYPNKEASLLPALHAVQDQVGWLPIEAMDWVADKLDLPKTRVYGVTSFYTMFRRKPSGRHRLEICTNVPCSLMGAEHLRDYLGKKLSIKPGQTTSDGKITLSEVECLGSCGTAPVMMVDDVYHENLDPEKIDAILADLDTSDKEASNG
jgi:NADH-quinone oxidoreductase subunit E